jgi:hypothetical protein
LSVSHKGGDRQLEVFAQSFEEGMPDHSLGRFGAILNLGKQLRFDPDALVRDPLGVGLGRADKGLEASPQFGGRSNQAQVELPRVLRCVAIDEFLQMRRDVGQLQIAAMLDFAGDVLRDVFRPALRRVEGHDPDRPAILAGDQILDDRLEVRGLEVGLAPGASCAPEISATK